MSVCVCVRERESARESECESLRESESESEGERERVCSSGTMCAFGVKIMRWRVQSLRFMNAIASRRTPPP